MKSRISFFNRTLFWKDITRFWPLWTIEMFLLLISVVIPMYSAMDIYQEYGQHRYGMGFRSSKRALCDALEGYGPCLTNGVVLAGVALVVALFLFSYLFKARETYNAHYLPMRRETIFISHYLAGLTILLVPFLVTYTILVCVAASYKVGIVMELLGQLVITLVGIIFFFSLACLVIMLTANGIMASVIYVVLNLLYQSITTMLVSISGLCIFGYQGDERIANGILGQYLTPVAFFSGENSIIDMIWGVGTDYEQYAGSEYAYSTNAYGGYTEVQLHSFWMGPDWDRTLWYLIPAVLFLGLAVLLYKKRSLEVAGDMLAFSWGKPIFRFVFTVAGSMAFSVLLYSICVEWAENPITYNGAFVLFLGLLAVGSLLAYLISNMILQKTFFIWKKTSYWRMLLLTGMILGIFSCMKYGYGENIPAAAQVDYIKLEIQQGGHYKLKNSFYVQEEQQIEAFQKIHENIIEYGQDVNLTQNRYQYPKEIGVTYVTKSGTHICRNYPISYTSWKELGLISFLNDKETMCEKAFSKAYEDVTPLSVEIVFYSGESLAQFLDYETMYRFYEAALKDMEEGNMTLEQRESADYYLDIRINVPKDSIEKNGFSTSFIKSINDAETVIELPISDSCKALTELMNETVYSDETTGFVD